jgi:Flp pilus assembly protein TadD
LSIPVTPARAAWFAPEKNAFQSAAPAGPAEDAQAEEEQEFAAAPFEEEAREAPRTARTFEVIDVTGHAAKLGDRRLDSAGENLPAGVERRRGRRDRRRSRDEDEDHSWEREKPAFVRLMDSLRNPGPTQVAIFTALAVVLGAGGWMGWRWMHQPRGEGLRVVVGDFEDSTGSAEFASALRTSLSNDLQQTPYLDVATEERIAGALRELKQPVGQTLTHGLARQVCRQMKGQVLIDGSISRFARKYVVTVEAFDCAAGDGPADGAMARSRGLADTPDGAVTVLDKVAADVRKQLGEPAKSIARFNKPFFPEHTGSLAALEAFAEAVHLGQGGKLGDSVPLFQRAVELDPKFAIAMADLGVTYTQLGETELALGSLTKAYELRDSAGEQDRFFIVAAYNAAATGDIPSELRNYQSWSSLYPRNAFPQLKMAELEIEIGKAGLALAAVKRALELNPADAHAYVVQARAQMQVGQFEEVSATCRQAILRHVDGAEIHAMLYQLGFLRLDDAAMAEQVGWAKDQAATDRVNGQTPTAEPDLLMQQGWMEFAEGRVKAATATLATVAEEYRKLGKTAQASCALTRIPRAEAELGLVDTAAATLQRVAEGPGCEAAAADIPVAWAAVGETSKAEALLARALAAHPTDTLWQQDRAPQIRASVALDQLKAQDAIDALQDAAPYDLRSFDLPALRGRAYLGAKQPALAAAEFQKILDHPGIEPLSYKYPLARLGLARALAADGKLEEAGFAYKVLFQIWKDADPDLPRLKAAQAEYARLFSPAASPAAKPKTAVATKTPGAAKTPPAANHALTKPKKK